MKIKNLNIAKILKKRNASVELTPWEKAAYDVWYAAIFSRKVFREKFPLEVFYEKFGEKEDEDHVNFEEMEKFIRNFL